MTNPFSEAGRRNFDRGVKIGGAVVLGIFVLLALAGSWYTLDASRGEQAVVQRFGRYVATVSEPGLHFKMPFGIDRVSVERVQEVRRVEIGFRTSGRPEGGHFGSGHHFEPEPDHSVVITRDQNLVDAEYVVQYEISDLRKHLFRASNPHWTVGQAAKAVLREVISNRDIDDILTTGRDAMQQEAQENLQKILDAYDIGVRVKSVQFQDVHAPDRVIPAFNDVQKAKEERETSLNEGKRYTNQVIPKAEAEGQRIVTQAEGYKIRRANEATGDAARFRSLLESYRNNPDLVRRQLYLQVMAEILPGMPKTIIEAESGQFILPLEPGRKEK